MRYLKLLMCVPLLALGACDDDGITPPQQRGPTAPARFVNAGVDVGEINLRFVDRVENLPTFLSVVPRGSSGVYQAVGAGSRPAKVFPGGDGIDIDLAKTVYFETTANIQANTRYTYVFTGSRAANNARLHTLQDPEVLPTPPAGSIAVKVLHAAAGQGAVDVYLVPVASATAATPADFVTAAAAVIRNVGFETQSAYTNVAVRPTSGTPLYRVVVTAAGSTTPIFAATPNQPGAQPPAGATYGPQPGVQISGSVLTLVLFPGTTPGSRGSTTANQSPGAVFLIDKALNPS